MFNGTFLQNSATGNGGAINDFSGTMTVSGSTFDENTTTASNAAGGAGISIDEGLSATIINSTFVANNASGTIGGGGINNNGTVTLVNDTFDANIAAAGADLGSFNGGTANLKGTILAGQANGGNCTGGIVDNGYNLSDDSSCKFTNPPGTSKVVSDSDLALGPLQNNGGPTDTIALGSSSVAIDKIPHASCTFPAGTLNPCSNPPSLTASNQLTCDQRGEPRPDPVDGPNGNCDIGAYEFQATISCGNAFVSNPNLTALLPVMFFPEYIFGVNDQARAYTLKITGVTQDKQPTGFPLCPNAFWSGTTVYVRTNNEPLQPGPSGLLYSIEFTATDNATGASCTGAAPVCVQGLFQSGQQCLAPLDTSYDATKCP